MSDREETDHEELAVRPLSAHERRIEEDTSTILALLRGFVPVHQALQNDVRAMGERIDKLAERIAMLPTRHEVAELRRDIRGLTVALGDTRRELEQHREHTLEQYDLLGGRIRDLEVARNGNGSGNGHDPAPAEDAE